MISYSSMAMICSMCGKGRMVGKTHRHHPGVAGKRWIQRAPSHSKTFKPNLHWAHMLMDGTTKRLRLCTKCLRRAKEAMQIKSQVEVIHQAPQVIVIA